MILRLEMFSDLLKLILLFRNGPQILILKTMLSLLYYTPIFISLQIFSN